MVKNIILKNIENSLENYQEIIKKLLKVDRQEIKGKY